MVRDAAARVEREGTARGQQVVRSSLASGLSQSLGGKIYEVAELQLAGVGEAGGEAGELPGGEGGELGQTEGEEGGQQVSRHALITASLDCSGHSPLSAMSECQTNISFSLPACCLHIKELKLCCSLATENHCGVSILQLPRQLFQADNKL